MSMERGKRLFNTAQVEQIRHRYMCGESQRNIAKSLRVTVATIGRIVRGETYIDDPLGLETSNGLIDGVSGVSLRQRTPEEWLEFQRVAKSMGPMDYEELKEQVGGQEYKEKRAMLEYQGKVRAELPPISDEAARSFFRLMGRWPEGYKPPQENSDNQLEPSPTGE